MKHVGFILDGFELETPGQQLADRFLLGWNLAGEFRRSAMQVALSCPGGKGNPLLAARTRDFGLELASDDSVLANSELVVIAPGTSKPIANHADQIARRVHTLPSGKTYYFDAATALNQPSNRLIEEARSRRAKVLISRAAAHFIPLPVRPAFLSRRVDRALLVAHGAFPEAELDALHSLRPYLAESFHADPTTRRLAGAELWNFAYNEAWRSLLAAAVSRSDTMKGDPERDGRTQDIVGLRLIEKLSPEARAWHLRFRHLELMILVVSGALSDFGLAVADKNTIHSAQLYQPPAPRRDHYDSLADWIFRRAVAEEPEDARTALLLNSLVAQMQSS